MAACKPTENCAGYCGAGTHCDDDRCVPDAEVEPTDADVEPEPGKKKRRRKGRRKKGRRGGGDGEAGEAPPRVDDSHVPRYKANRTQTIGMSDGTERLSDFRVKNHMAKLEHKFNACIERAAMSTDETLRGTVTFTIGVEPTGKVWGVTAKAPSAMKKAGLVSCLRVAVHKSRFPTWDGPSMGVDYSFEVG